MNPWPSFWGKVSSVKRKPNLYVLYNLGKDSPPSHYTWEPKGKTIPKPYKLRTPDFQCMTRGTRRSPRQASVSTEPDPPLGNFRGQSESVLNAAIANRLSQQPGRGLRWDESGWGLGRAVTHHVLPESSVLQKFIPESLHRRHPPRRQHGFPGAQLLIFQPSPS